MDGNREGAHAGLFLDEETIIFRGDGVRELIGERSVDIALPDFHVDEPVKIRLIEGFFGRHDINHFSLEEFRPERYVSTEIGMVVAGAPIPVSGGVLISINDGSYRFFTGEIDCVVERASDVEVCFEG